MNASDANESFNNRILIIDDNPSIHDDFRKILTGTHREKLRELEDEEVALFGTQKKKAAGVTFELTSALQGQEGLALVQAAATAGKPFAMAFVDVRMPPGWDGIETISRIWAEFPELQVVICTAYTDRSWDEIARTLAASDSILILKKPFDSVEVLQMAHALTRKWHLARIAERKLAELDALVQSRTAELQKANGQLKSEVAERWAAEVALRQSEERFSKAFRVSPVPMAIEHWQRAAFIDVNASFERMTGRCREELLGEAGSSKSIWKDTGTAGLVRRLVKQGQPPRDMPVSIRTKDGKCREALLFMEPLELTGEGHLLLIAQDITEHSRLEEQLRQSQKMEAVGRLAAGVAHDFNNILTVIIGNASNQLATPGLSESLSRALNQVVKAADRATELTRQLLAYSRRQIIQRRALNVNEHVTQTVAMLRRVIGEDISMVTELADELPPIFADPGNVDQVLMNLVFNARDAMPKGGRLRIATARETVSKEAVARRPERSAGDYVKLAVHDTGHGMDAETMAQIFEPFFTTKETGRGTGMGLATAEGIVKQHDGWIDVRSELGKGSTFEIYFPVYAGETLAAAAPAEEVARETNGPGGTILVVEDEEMLRLFVTEVLSGLGYRVFSAANGAEALEIWAREKEQIDLLFTDIVMPESISGRELARQLLSEKITLKVIYTSGYSAELVDSDFETEAAALFLAKPYHSDRLAKIVASCLSVA